MSHLGARWDVVQDRRSADLELTAARLDRRDYLSADLADDNGRTVHGGTHPATATDARRELWGDDQRVREDPDFRAFEEAVGFVGPCLQFIGRAVKPALHPLDGG